VTSIWAQPSGPDTELCWARIFFIGIQHSITQPRPLNRWTLSTI
jgi:hypothetical protein